MTKNHITHCQLAASAQACTQWRCGNFLGNVVPVGAASLLGLPLGSSIDPAAMLPACALPQVEQQLAVTTGERDNWGDLYAAYVDWLKTNPSGDLTFPAWRASPAAGKFQEKMESSGTAAAAGPGGAQQLNAAYQHSSL